MSNIIHVWDDESELGSSFGVCGEEITSYTFLIENATCVKCLWALMKDGNKASDRLQYLQLNGLVPPRTKE